MIYLTGDTHIPIDISKLNMKQFPEQKDLTRDDYLIILGDFGLYWHEDREYAYWRKWLQEKPFTVLWVDGNHENHDWIARMPVTQWMGGLVQADGNIIHLMRGQIYHINDKSFFVMGGAASTDKEHRQDGISWWPQEVPSFQDVEVALDNLENEKWKVDYVLTHTCPTNIINPMFHVPPTSDSATKFLQEVYWRIKFKKWYFGHWHVDHNYGKFCCMYDNIVKMEEGL